MLITMKIGYLFAGQGNQKVGMGKNLYESYDEVKKIYDIACDITNVDIRKISFEGPEEALNKTENTQIATYVESMAIVDVLNKNNIKPEYTAGLSLGEYSALTLAGVFTFEEGVKLVQKRGEIMQSLTPKGDWKMSAIMRFR